MRKPPEYIAALDDVQDVIRSVRERAAGETALYDGIRIACAWISDLVEALGEADAQGDAADDSESLR